MLDVVSLRVALTTVAVTLIVLTLVAGRGDGRSHYARWWTWSLLATGASSALYALNHTSAQAFAVPAANALATAGPMFAWVAARSLRGRRLHPAIVAAGPLIIGAAAAFDTPATNIWAGAEATVFAIAAALTMTAREVYAVHVAQRGAPTRHGDGAPGRAVPTLLAAVAMLGSFYWFRFAVMLTAGIDSHTFTVYAGSVATTLMLIVSLVVVTFTMSQLGELERTHHLRRRAEVDALTGLLNRDEFERRAGLLATRTDAAVPLVFIDLDHFKRLNDTYGHRAGDASLIALADACRELLDGDDLAARVGGEEFVVALADADPQRAATRVERIGRRYRKLAAERTVPATTLSCGVTLLTGADDLARALDRADAAMYRAKQSGRDLVVIDVPEPAAHPDPDGETPPLA